LSRQSKADLKEPMIDVHSSPKADIAKQHRHVRKVPKAEVPRKGGCATHQEWLC
jgi:hypothetical protein